MACDERVLLSIVEDVVLARYPDGTYEEASLDTIGRSPVLLEAMDGRDGDEVTIAVPTGYTHSWLQCVRVMPEHMRSLQWTCPIDEALLALRVNPPACLCEKCDGVVPKRTSSSLKRFQRDGTH